MGRQLLSHANFIRILEQCPTSANLLREAFLSWTTILNG